MSFQFQQFIVDDSNSTMPVSTDSMLLGALTDPGTASSILDIGTGCGVLALMMAQKSKAMIDAIEIDKDSAQEASGNFQKSPWNTRLGSFGISLQLFEFLTDHRYDLIISNPPFFRDSLKSANHKKNMARHDLTLTFKELIKDVTTLLKKDGRFAYIIPADQWPETCKIAERHLLYPKKIVQIYPYPGALASRVITELSMDLTCEIQESELTILNEERKFSPEYLAVTKDFHYF